MTGVEAAEKMAGAIEGWLTVKEGRLLYELARSSTGRGAIVEIGSWQGKSTVWLGLGSRAGNGAKVYAIDPHTGAREQREEFGDVWTLDRFTENVRRAGIETLVVPLVMTSEEAARRWRSGDVELLWIDGAHEYEFVRRDFELWSPFLAEGGIVAFHDRSAPGPSRVIAGRVLRSRRFRLMGRVDQILFARKVARLGPGVALRQAGLALRYDLARRSRALPLLPSLWRALRGASRRAAAGTG
jgi:predicted O-methyltransferase YrrM